MNSQIAHIFSSQILDSRGNPTVEVTIELKSGAIGTAGIPSGASTGIHEACEMRDTFSDSFHGRGVRTALYNIQQVISPHIVNRSLTQEDLDEELIRLDGSKRKMNLGSNALLGISLAFCQAQAHEQRLELFQWIHSMYFNQNAPTLPTPCLNVINGGKHAHNNLAFQEFMIIPHGLSTFYEKIQASSTIISQLENLLVTNGYSTGIGDEGGFAPSISSHNAILDLIEHAIKTAGYSFDTIGIGIDIAASSFFSDKGYRLSEEAYLNATDMREMYVELTKNHPIISLEDPFHEDDFESFSILKKNVDNTTIIVGDDLTTTNVERIKHASTHDSIHSVLIKPNQIGTFTETIRAITYSQENGLIPFISHRSGETTDTFIADLAVACNAPYIKAGSLRRGERVVKYNRLLKIEGLIS
jgi:enolase